MTLVMVLDGEAGVEICGWYKAARLLTHTTNTPQPRDEGGEMLLNDSKFYYLFLGLKWEKFLGTN